MQARRGAAVVEFALVVPVMLTLTFGLIEMGRISMVKEAVTQATREGARVGVRPTASLDDVRTRVNEELQIMGITGATVVVTPTQWDAAMPGDDVSVSITIPISAVSLVPSSFSFASLDIVAETVMRRESTGE
jgi:hypothetical protein